MKDNKRVYQITWAPTWVQTQFNYYLLASAKLTWESYHLSKSWWVSTETEGNMQSIFPWDKYLVIFPSKNGNHSNRTNHKLHWLCNKKQKTDLTKTDKITHATKWGSFNIPYLKPGIHYWVIWYPLLQDTVWDVGNLEPHGKEGCKCFGVHTLPDGLSVRRAVE